MSPRASRAGPGERGGGGRGGRGCGCACACICYSPLRRYNTPADHHIHNSNNHRVYTMLTKRYLVSAKNLPSIMSRIVEGAAPSKFSQDHLRGIGFNSSNDRAVIPLLKAIGFLSSDGTPAERYHAYRDRSRSKAVMAEALREAYRDIFTINEKPTSDDRDAIRGRFKSTHNVSDRVAELQAMTFFALLELADLDASQDSTFRTPVTEDVEQDGIPTDQPLAGPHDALPKPRSLQLGYNIEVHLPATKDIHVYNAIFKSLREHLLVD